MSDALMIGMMRETSIFSLSEIVSRSRWHCVPRLVEPIFARARNLQHREQAPSPVRNGLREFDALSLVYAITYATDATGARTY